MKARNGIRRGGVAGVVAGLLGLWSVSSPAQSPLLVPRPLTHQDIHDYGLPTNLQVSGGLDTVGIGQPVYLELLLPKSMTNVTGVTWELTVKPVGSADILLESPLGPNVPAFDPRAQLDYNVVDRRLLKPSAAGQYSVQVTVNLGTTNLVLRRNVSAGTYLGAWTCALCHSGGAIAENKYAQWQQTAHATFFQRAINGEVAPYYRASCIQCHVVGYDTDPAAVNGGFDDVAAQLGWTFPSRLSPTNWAALPQALKNLANIQCENCHGAGSEHALALGQTNLFNWPRITVSYSAGDCAQCHSEEPYHVYPLQWANSRHAVAVRQERTDCVGCHQGIGFIDRMKGVPMAQRRTQYESINCSACHDPHDATNPHQLRAMGPVTLADGFTVVAKGGKGLLCMNCHMSRQNATNYVEVTAGSNRFGPHYGPQADMLVGANAVTYGKVIPSSAHYQVVGDSCVACHMQDTDRADPAHLQVGGHTWKMAWDTGSNRVELVRACVQCHGDIDTFDFKRQDYDGDGIIEGVQTEVKGLLEKLAMMLPPVGQPVVASDTATRSKFTRAQLRALYNYLFVLEDGSYGIHNLSYAVGLLKASIADLSGDANNDGLPDWWQQAYFTGINDPMAAPNASPAGDGVPNWLKFALGLDPRVPGVALPDGVVFVQGKNLGGGDEKVRIYTAAEITFDTKPDKRYQIQAVSSLGGGWQNIGAPIQGTGQPVSYLTPTRANVQQYYRVIELD
ncbi:hypothetical protein G4L39_07620 [Limisphaera ngatamarikiensis]|uniref:Cytochrome c domain-containing protein n=1 Tax=Limisphaera ngatamarikiensis TaxID=1324935 RepID=A0A6M1RHY6_9BACT|nr:multiheme c-type cytochrome [Limisphaera ngatamarikiensis]NGO39266.1 hypothetical protein [Limisphaera ngatamarikiensis]